VHANQADITARCGEARNDQPQMAMNRAHSRSQFASPFRGLTRGWHTPIAA
jgi:hypothetical protein